MSHPPSDVATLTTSKPSPADGLALSTSLMNDAPVQGQHHLLPLSPSS